MKLNEIDMNNKFIDAFTRLGMPATLSFLIVSSFLLNIILEHRVCMET
jgi:hypothetical protein